MKRVVMFNLVCTQPGCSDAISLEVKTDHDHGLGGGHIEHALHEAAKLLGWKERRCPKHAPTETTE